VRLAKLIVRAAQTEDLRHGSTLAGMNVVNPFA
jgi:hypothetical protein